MNIRKTLDMIDIHLTEDSSIKSVFFYHYVKYGEENKQTTMKIFKNENDMRNFIIENLDKATGWCRVIDNNNTNASYLGKIGNYQFTAKEANNAQQLVYDFNKNKNYIEVETEEEVKVI